MNEAELHFLGSGEVLGGSKISAIRAGMVLLLLLLLLVVVVVVVVVVVAYSRR